MTKNFEEILLYHPFPNGSEGHGVHPDGQKFMDLFNEMGEVQKQDKPIYIKILRGDRKGSIAKFISKREYLSASHRFTHYGDKKTRYEPKGIDGHFIWDGRRNKIRAYLYPSFKNTSDFAWLKNYEGPTVYKLFNKKIHVEKKIKSTPQKDIDGNILKIGDRVLYCNIRYGTSTALCYGTIKEFKGKTYKSYGDKQTTSIYTIIVNEGNKEESKIEHSHLMIKRLH